MQEDKIKQGDTVMLKSASPVMVVESISQDKAHCKWYIHEQGAIGEAGFFITSLKKVDSKEI